jgi:putative mRNA 3-end processing factor
MLLPATDGDIGSDLCSRLLRTIFEGMKPEALLHPTPAGLFCPIGRFHVDPVRPVSACADHPRPFRPRALGHGIGPGNAETLDIMALRYGEGFAGTTQAAELGETNRRSTAFRRPFTPPATCWAPRRSRRAWRQRIVALRRLQAPADQTCAPFEPVAVTCSSPRRPSACRSSGTHPDTGEIGGCSSRHEQFPERAHLVGAYALGKAQRVMRLLRDAGYDEPSTSTARWPGSATTTRARASISAISGPATLENGTKGEASPAPSSSARPPPSPIAGRGAFPSRSRASPRAGCASASAPNSAASNCR